MGLQTDIANLLNTANREAISDTPDFILAHFILEALKAFESAMKLRTQYFSMRTGKSESPRKDRDGTTD